MLEIIKKHHRRSIRLPGADYSVPGFYFVTICTKDREELFGKIVGGEMVLNEFGEIVIICWQEIPKHFLNVIIDEFIIMPNHVHGIIQIEDFGYMSCRGTACRAPTTAQFGKPISGSLATIIRSCKSVVSNRINKLRKFDEGGSVWQRNYYEHIIRNQKSLENIRQYIQSNPVNWTHDLENSEFSHLLKEAERERQAREQYNKLFI